MADIGVEQKEMVKKYKAARGAAWNVVFRTLRKHRMSNMVDADDAVNYPLVDLLTADGRSIADGEMQMVELADEITLALNVT